MVAKDLKEWLPLPFGKFYHETCNEVQPRREMKAPGRGFPWLWRAQIHYCFISFLFFVLLLCFLDAWKGHFFWAIWTFSTQDIDHTSLVSPGESRDAVVDAVPRWSSYLASIRLPWGGLPNLAYPGKGELPPVPHVDASTSEMLAACLHSHIPAFQVKLASHE